MLAGGAGASASTSAISCARATPVDQSAPLGHAVPVRCVLWLAVYPYTSGSPTKTIVMARGRLARPVTLRGWNCSSASPLRFWYREGLPFSQLPVTAAQLRRTGSLSPRFGPWPARGMRGGYLILVDRPLEDRRVPGRPAGRHRDSRGQHIEATLLAVPEEGVCLRASRSAFVERPALDAIAADQRRDCRGSNRRTFRRARARGATRRSDSRSLARSRVDEWMPRRRRSGRPAEIRLADLARIASHAGRS